ncbi:RING-H2 finger protein ATL33-like [Mercurialis annua]|uniref:RING-H2 finger protein ATL33-like n=1 Tax=Mercurialis annua TaxID=3986 RepID=UPI00215F6BF8|nr:RING-H2 finger protein ATL33-like [Mercurialis annua]
MEQHTPTIFIAPDPPPFPSSPRSVDLSPLEFILALVAVITIPALIYTFFFSIKCPPSPFRSRRGRSSTSDSDENDGGGDGNNPTGGSNKEVVSSEVKYQKETHVKDVGSECPVCLSGFGDGEDIKQLSGCKHSFHASCIDLWLNSHSNCPVCRASVPSGKRPGNVSSSRSRDQNSDFHQGLPDAANLV